MGPYLMFADFGSASAASSFAQWRYAFRRSSSIHSGSPFRVQISLMMSSLRPLGTESYSTADSNPYLYSWVARDSIDFSSVLISTFLSHCRRRGLLLDPRERKLRIIQEP